MYGTHKILKATRINSNWIQLTFNSVAEREKLNSAVSFEIPGAKYSASCQSGLWDGRKSFLTKTNRIKSGIFKAIFPDHPLVYNKEHSLLTFDSIPLFADSSYERRDYQLDAINSIFNNKLGIISVVMGGGKTLIAAGTSSYHLSLSNKNKVLFVVYDINILSQSMTNFTKYGFKVSQYGDKIKDLSGDIVVATIQSLNNLEDPKSVLKKFTFLFLDEAHHGKAKTSKAVLGKLTNCEHRIGLTATPYKEKTIELADLQSVLGPVIFEYGFKEAVEAGSVIPVKCFFLDLPINKKIDEELTFRRNYKTVWDEAISLNPERNEIIGKILTSVIDLLDTPNIILCDRVNHGQELARVLKNQPLIKLHQSYGSDDISVRELKREQLQTMEINTIISSILGEGVDMPISPVIAINASGRQSFIKLIQFLGRITRRNERFGGFRCYIDLINREHRFVEEHSLSRIESCKEFGCAVEIFNNLNDLLVAIIKYYKSTKPKP